MGVSLFPWLTSGLRWNWLVSERLCRRPQGGAVCVRLMCSSLLTARPLLCRAGFDQDIEGEHPSPPDSCRGETPPTSYSHAIT